MKTFDIFNPNQSTSLKIRKNNYNFALQIKHHAHDHSLESITRQILTERSVSNSKKKKKQFSMNKTRKSTDNGEKVNFQTLYSSMENEQPNLLKLIRNSGLPEDKRSGKVLKNESPFILTNNSVDVSNV